MWVGPPNCKRKEKCQTNMQTSTFLPTHQQLWCVMCVYSHDQTSSKGFSNYLLTTSFKSRLWFWKTKTFTKFTPGLTYDVNNSKIWVQFFCHHGLARKCHSCILTTLNQLISGLKKKFSITIFHEKNCHFLWHLLFCL